MSSESGVDGGLFGTQHPHAFGSASGSMSFYEVPVPEPGVLALLTLGGLAVLRTCRA